ncbi:DUF4397 domain-containing protein [Pedobacter glucosidilyticus]|uniref:DUF4397 domain-containing protein n=1 Tax=Pedobacter glucosidilyticus TaxID=1122941 RepID=UPI0026F0E8B9|nr:DUF4397 domain-containing protein [Pedobacter glucosidilyticus]
MKSKKYILYSIALFAAAFSACKEETREGITDASNMAKVAIMQTATEVRPGLTTHNPTSLVLGYYFNLDGRRLYSQVMQVNRTTGYFLSSPGSKNLLIDSTRFVADFIQPSANVASVPLNLERGKYYSVFLGGRIQAPDVLVTEDNFTRPVAGKASIRFVHMSPDTGPIDLATGPSTATAANLSTLISNLAFKNASQFVTVDAGGYKLSIRPTGVTTAIPTFTSSVAVNNSQILPTWINMATSTTNEFTLKFESGKVYTMVLRGYQNVNLTNPTQIGSNLNRINVGTVINMYW